MGIGWYDSDVYVVVMAKVNVNRNQQLGSYVVHHKSRVGRNILLSWALITWCGWVSRERERERPNCS